MTNKKSGKKHFKVLKRAFKFRTNCQGLSEVIMVIFISDYNLRSHTVKHFLDIEEWDGAWKNFKDETFNIKSLEEARKELEHIDCLGIKMGFPSGCCKGCNNFLNSCAKILNQWENKYIEVIKESISWSLPRPLFVKYKGLAKKEDKNSDVIDIITMLMEHPDIMNVAKSLDTNQYNITTSYKNRKTKRMLINSIKNSASDKDSIIFCNHQTWGIYDDLDNWKKQLLALKGINYDNQKH